MSRKKLSRNAPCPCGSGKKYKQCCIRKDFDWLEDDEGNVFKSLPLSDEKEPPQFPIGTVALYGPDDKTTTKIVAGVFLGDDSEPILERWVGTEVTVNPKVQKGINEFFTQHGVTSVTAVDQNMGCPHEEGEDFPVGGDCPFCPYWKGRQGSNAEF